MPSMVGSHMEMASHVAPSAPVHHVLPPPPTPQPVPSQLVGPNMVPFSSSYQAGQPSPQPPLVPHSLSMTGQPLTHISPHPQVAVPLRPGTLPLVAAGSGTGPPPHHPMHHFVPPPPHPPHGHVPPQTHLAALTTPGAPAQSPHAHLHPQATVQTPQPPGPQVTTPSQSQTPTIIQIRFFGHESRQMIPPEFCLIGCVFYIAPYYLESANTARLVPGWRRQIEKYGGRVVEHYQSGASNSNLVTHVVTENMSSPMAKQALQEGRRCVSIFWLEDVLCNKRLLPPWRFYHLPVAYGDTKPCRNHVCSGSSHSHNHLTKNVFSFCDRSFPLATLTAMNEPV